MADRHRHSLARWLAPLALVTCAVAVYAVVHNTLKDDTPSSGSQTTHRATPSTSTTRKATAGKRRRKTYVVKPGDTLSGIAVKTGVPLATIQRLNPKLDADTLRTGQKVRLAR